MCDKFHTPLRMVQVRNIISWQKCDFSLKHLNLYLTLKNSVVFIKKSKMTVTDRQTDRQIL